MDKVTIIQELLAEVGGMQQQLEVMKTQLEVMKQRLMLAEVSMQADAAALQASQLRVKQLEIIVASQKSQVDELPNRGTDESLNRENVESLNRGIDESLTCGTDESPNRLNDSIKNSVAELVEAPKCDYSHSFINSSTIQRFNDSSTKNPDSSTPSRDARIITDLKKAIGLNDRFRLKHDLFDNNETLLFETIDALNSLSCMADADAYLKERFAWKADDATVVYFYEILERKFVRS